MDIEEQVIAEAQLLHSYLYDEVEAIFLPPDAVSEIIDLDIDYDDWKSDLKEQMSPIEKEWFDLIDDIKDLVDNFLYDNGYDPFGSTEVDNNG